jgi:hypothetical protein
MNNRIFQAVVNNQIATCMELLKVKEEYYTRGEDRLKVFKQAAAIDGDTALESLKGMMKKHTIKLYQLIKDVKCGEKPAKAVWDEVLADHHNYFFLLRALLEDEGLIRSTQYDKGKELPPPVDPSFRRLYYADAKGSTCEADSCHPKTCDFRKGIETDEPKDD